MSLPDDGMDLGWNVPAPATTDEVVAVLEDVLAVVRAGDSFEGFVAYSMPTDEPWLEGADFGLQARYRVGNSMGQGGLSVFTKPRPE